MEISFALFKLACATDVFSDLRNGGTRIDCLGRAHRLSGYLVLRRGISALLRFYSDPDSCFCSFSRFVPAVLLGLGMMELQAAEWIPRARELALLARKWPKDGRDDGIEGPGVRGSDLHVFGGQGTAIGSE